jgi:hypothetical protein
MEGGEDGVVDVLGRPAADMTAAMQEDFEEADAAMQAKARPRRASTRRSWRIVR